MVDPGKASNDVLFEAKDAQMMLAAKIACEGPRSGEVSQDHGEVELEDDGAFDEESGVTFACHAVC